MAPFDLNETVCFDQNGLLWYKMTMFWLRQKKKKMGCQTIIVYHLQPFVLEMVLEWLLSRVFNALSLHQTG
jgi:hypothetical protein